MMVRIARNAMATRFELVLCGERESYLRASGEEALQEIVRLEEQLSYYLPTSEISHLNALAAQQAVPVDPRLFRLLQQAKNLWQGTQGRVRPDDCPFSAVVAGGRKGRGCSKRDGN